MREKSEKVTISLPEGLLERSKRYCGNTGRTLSGLIKILLERELKEAGKHGAKEG